MSLTVQHVDGWGNKRTGNGMEEIGVNFQMRGEIR